MAFIYKPVDTRPDRRRSLRNLDLAESRRVKKRSDGQCEVVFADTGDRCPRRATDIHHMRKPRQWFPGAGYKQHVCATCHHGITGDIGGRRLEVVQDGSVARFTDRYRRVRPEVG
jgi:ribosomal protein L31